MILVDLFLSSKSVLLITTSQFLQDKKQNNYPSQIFFYFSENPYHCWLKSLILRSAIIIAYSKQNYNSVLILEMKLIRRKYDVFMKT